MTIWNIRVQYQRTVMTAISKNQRCSKQTEVQKGQNMPNMQDVFSAEFQSSNLTCIHGTKMQDLNHAHSRFFLASTATQMTFMRIHTPTMPAAIITWVRLTTLDVFHVHILKKLRCRQRLREHTKQSVCTPTLDACHVWHRTYTVYCALLLSVHCLLHCTSLLFHCCFTVMSYGLSSIIVSYLSKHCIVVFVLFFFHPFVSSVFSLRPLPRSSMQLVRRPAAQKATGRSRIVPSRKLQNTLEFYKKQQMP